MSNLFNKQGMTAYQRWEMTSFNEPAPKFPESVDSPLTVAEEVIPSITEAELQSIRDDAQREGYAAGFTEAYSKGLSEGQAQGLSESREQTQAELARLTDIIDRFHDEINQSSKQLGQQILDLALDLAQTLLHKQLELDKTAILPIVEDAIDQLIQVKQPAQLFLNPQDAATVQAHLGEKLSLKGWQIVADPHLDIGGCHLESASNVIDASLALRWQRLHDFMQQQRWAASE